MSNGLERFLGGPPGRTLLWLAFLCVVIGFVLATVGLDPIRLVRRIVFGFDDLVRWILAFGGDILAGLGRYFLVGAVVVVPIWLVLRVMAVGRGR